MPRVARFSILAVTALVALMVLLIVWARADDTRSADTAVVRADSHRLTDVPDSAVTVVEFLDLECEACRAAYPGVERLRAEYGDRVTFVLRYFPIPSHQNAELAARAVEAAGRQGQLEPMYQMMYETQPEWGEQTVSQRDMFVEFATRLGLDVPRFERDVDDPATAERVLADRADGMELGVQGTPTFFINDSKFEGAPTYEALKAAIERELDAAAGK
jgi:protein-disulfide isomerase